MKPRQCTSEEMNTVLMDALARSGILCENFLRSITVSLKKAANMKVSGLAKLTDLTLCSSIAAAPLWDLLIGW